MIRNVKRALFLDQPTRRFIRHNRRAWRRPPAPADGPIVLIDCYNVPQSTLAYSFLANALQRREAARIVVFGVRSVLRQLDMYRVFRSFGARGYVQSRLDRADAQAIGLEAHDLVARLRSRRDLLDLEIDGINIGQDVYESYLRRFFAATVDLTDPELETLLAEALGYLRFWQRYLEANDVRAVIVSEDCYVEHNILCRLAYQRGIAAYMPHAYRIVKLDRPSSPYLAFPHYRTLFSALPEEIREAGVAMAADRLRRRMEGRPTRDIINVHYTAFSQQESPERAIRESDRLKVLVCTHCFFDNPHVYGGMIFEDFAAWVSHLGRFADTTDYDWYIKTHPDPLPGTEAIVSDLVARHPRLTPIPSTVGHPQLVREGIDVVLTCYGTVGEEYPLMGVAVQTAGYHPRIAYDFNEHARTIEDYDRKLRSLTEIAPPTVDERDVYEFYFMHHIYSYADDLILDSYEAFAEGKSATELLGTRVYEHYLDSWDERRHQGTISRIDEYLSSGARYLYRYGAVAIPTADAAEHSVGTW